ncbi:hypothetical protein [Thiospirillum jenense]|nr:hypothetical protein [Thiospirillum jenense]
MMQPPAAGLRISQPSFPRLWKSSDGAFWMPAVAGMTTVLKMIVG